MDTEVPSRNERTFFAASFDNSIAREPQEHKAGKTIRDKR